METQTSHFNQSSPTAIEHKPNFWRVATIVLFIVLIGIGGIYLFNSQSQKPMVTSSRQIVEPTIFTPQQIEPTVNKTNPPVDNGISIKQNTIQFARIDNEIYIRHKGTINNQESVNQSRERPIQFSNPIDTYTWYGLVDVAQADQFHAVDDSIQDLAVFPNRYNFIFMILSINKRDYKSYDDSKIFYYDIFKTGNDKVSNILTTTSKDTYWMPTVNQISPDGEYIAFDMHICWACGETQPEVMLFKIDTKTTQRVGNVSYFNWRNNGNYEYKEYRIIPCNIEGGGECSEDPKNLPLLKGQFSI